MRRRFRHMWGYGVELDIDIRELVAKRVKALRRRARKGSRELSRELGYGHGFISEVERRQRELSYRALWTLANYFDTTVEAIVGPPRTRAEHEWMVQRINARSQVTTTPAAPPVLGRRKP